MTKELFKNTKINAVFIMMLAFLIAGCKEMLPVPQVAQNNTESKSVLAAPTKVTATHGLKRKIRLTWAGSSSAKCYYIYSASTPFDEYKQINETTNDNTFIELDVPSGYSGYFKVAAVNGLGEVSDRSLAVYGTSLATPQITSIQEDENSATVYWFMENLSKKTYLDDIHFTAICYNSKNEEVERKTLAGTTETFCTFEGLNSGSKYFYEIEAFLGSNGDSIEKSLKLDSETVVSLTPAVPKFTVSEGTEESKIDITITLPQMVKILIESASGGANQASYEDRPLYFKIDRLKDGGEYETLVNYIPFNYNSTGSLEKITEGSDVFNDYKEGDIVTYSDETVERGKKYSYKVFACTDNYSKNTAISDEKKTTPQTGWAAAIPRIFSSSVEYEYETVTSEDDVEEQKKKGAKFEITTAWDSLGKENDYVYMLLQNRKKLKTDNGGEPDNDGTDSFVAKSDGSCYFDTLEEIKSVPLTFDLSTSESCGYYRYSFYIVPKSVKTDFSDPNSDVERIKELCLTHIDDISSKLISDGGEIKAPEIKVHDGYKDKVRIEWTTDSNVKKYKLVRYTLDNSGSIDNSITPLAVEESAKLTGIYTDTEVESGKAYSYTLYASNDELDDIPSNTEKAYTLGTPEVTFDVSEIDYDSITVKWNSVLHNAEYLEKGASSHEVKYKVEYNGNTYEILQSDMTDETDSTVEKKSEEYDIKCIDGKEFIFTLKKQIKDFNYSGSKPAVSASKAGAESELKVMACNDVTETEPSNYTQGSVPVKVLGPAEIALTASQATKDKQIDVSWEKIEGAAGYVIRRVCPRTALGEEEDKTDYITVSAGGNITNNGESVGSGRTVLTSNSDVINISDKYCAASDATSLYQTNQEKIDVGLEYKYTVMPVKSLSDNPFEDFEIMYNFDGADKTGYTHGYGINIIASKADYADKVYIEWEKPNSSLATFPQAFYRKVGDTEWQAFGQLSSGDTDISFVPAQSDRDKKFEFMVSYKQGESANFENTYISYQKEQTSADTDYGEQNNMGYQFALPDGNLTAEKPTASNESFTEKIYWTLWDANTRKHAPDSYEIMVKNLNCSSEWFTIATISKDGTVSPVNKNWYDVNYNLIGNSVMQITAQSVTADSGYHNGLLKVQRDYKHYYKLVAKRKVKDDEGNYREVITALGEFDNTDRSDAASKEPIYTYRQISNEEFAKCVTLNLADAVHQKGGEGGTRSGASGSITTRYVYQASIAYKFYYTLNEYVNRFYKLPGDDNSLISDFTLSSSESSAGWAYDCKNYAFGENTITVTHKIFEDNTEKYLPSYQGSITLSAGRQKKSTYWDLNLEYKNNSVSTAGSVSISENESAFKEWFPYALGTKISSENDGTNSSYPTMTDVWWQVRTLEDD
ncbi:MAG: hypothetical protein ACI4LX_10015 [Treponema sp.]